MYISIHELEHTTEHTKIRTIDVPSNVMDFASIGNKMIVATDSLHEAHSAERPRSDDARRHYSSLRLLAINANGSMDYENGELQQLLMQASESMQAPADEKTLRDILYGIGHLRKRGGEDGLEEPT